MPTCWFSVRGIMVAWLHCVWTMRHHGGDHVMEHSCSPHSEWEAESKGEGPRCRPQVHTFKDPLSSIRFNFTSHRLSNYESFNELIHWLVPSPHDPTTFQSPSSGKQAFSARYSVIALDSNHNSHLSLPPNSQVGSWAPASLGLRRVKWCEVIPNFLLLSERQRTEPLSSPKCR